VFFLFPLSYDFSDMLFIRIEAFPSTVYTTVSSDLFPMIVRAGSTMVTVLRRQQPLFFLFQVIAPFDFSPSSWRGVTLYVCFLVFGRL